ncbi:MAG: TrkH family potassium uptake protein, partial [Oscillospiraceae bacterium]|nr:TrkH family potassium uptake protein [Oscillospiraceae bacterium]
MSKDSVGAILKYFAIYIIIVVVSVLLISIENVDGTTTLTAVMATFNNIGPGLNLVGPTANYAFFSDFSKIVLSMDMLFGRLELYPMLVLFLPHTWARKWN